MPGFVHVQQPVDVIARHQKNGTIIPLKIRLQDEDGEYQSYAVRSYRCTNLTESIDPRRFPVVMFECKILSFGKEHIIGIAYNFTDGLWKLLEPSTHSTFSKC